MARVAVSRTFDAAPDAIRAAMEDVSAFIAATGVDEVAREDGTVTVKNRMGPMTIELVLEVVEAPGAALAYEQRSGPFASMRTVYEVGSVAGGTAVTAHTEFELGAPVVGEVLDATVVRRQRRRELEAQMDWLAERVGPVD
jgi:hypothetical protein